MAFYSDHSFTNFGTTATNIHYRTMFLTNSKEHSPSWEANSQTLFHLLEILDF